MYKVRRRLINFRVSDEELEMLKTAAASHGSRCLSEFARATMLKSLTAGAALSRADSVEERIEILALRLNVLEANVSRLAGELKPQGS